MRGRIGDLWPALLRRRRPRLIVGLADLEAALTRDECPVCARTGGIENRWIDHFLYEGYQEPEVMAAVLRGGGFCAWHARRLEQFSAGSTIAWVYLYAILDKFPSRLSHRQHRTRARELVPDPGYCLACDQLHDAERRECFFLSLLLKERGLQCYGRPAIVCMPHLLQLGDFLDRNQIGQIFGIHARSVANLQSMLCTQGRAPVAPVIDSAAARAIQQIFGRPSRGSALLPEGAEDPFQAERDPIVRLRRRLEASQECPVCVEVAQSCRDWLRWLADTAKGPDDISDVVPLCRHHVWQGCAEPSPTLVGWLARVAASEAQTRLAYAKQALTFVPSGPRAIPEQIRRGWAGRHRRAEALQSLHRARECPLCRRAHEARDRVILLLAALLDEQEGRRAFERGYGLCIPHASRALRLLDGRVASQIIAQTIRARLGVLRWELEEQLRRCSWGARPEGHGAEAGAWRRATLRFSGTVCDDGP